MFSMTLGNAFKSASGNHAIEALAGVMLSTQSSLFGIFLGYIEVVFGGCWHPVCLACYSGKHTNANFRHHLDYLFTNMPLKLLAWQAVHREDLV